MTPDDTAAPPPRPGGPDRYLALLKAALLDLHRLEDEARIGYLTTLPPGTEPDPEVLRDPARNLEVPFKRLVQSRRAGRSADHPRGVSYTPHTDMGVVALDHLEAAVADVLGRGVEGDLAEVGVGRGGGGILLRACLDVPAGDGRTVWMIDPFLASRPEGPPEEHPSRSRLRADLNIVRDGFAHFGLLDERVRFLQGGYADSLEDAPIGSLALLRVGMDACYDLGAVLGRLLPKVSPGGVVIVEGVGRPVLETRLATFRDRRGLRGQPEHVDWNTVAWRVDAAAGPPPAEGEPERPAGALHRVPLPPPATGAGPDLSVVVVFYDMAREAPRTLRSLSRSYQRDVDDVDYEVIVVDNGSHADQALSAADVAAFGPEFRLVALADAPASPTVALNRGIAEARGRDVAVMIDGAHVLTPGVFRHALAALRTYDPAVVAVQHWYLGPGQQGDAQQAGYDQDEEDRLLRGIRWPVDGYRMFEVGHFIGDRDWFDGITESNCLFAPRWLLEQVGGFDDSFDMPGGGYANLELFERLHAHPGITPTSLLGEATFHQFHGGTTTNVADEAMRRARILSYRDHFRRTRGRDLNGLTKPVHYLGSMDTKAARRTRSRRQFSLSFDPDRDPVEATAAPPRPVPDELKLAAIEALWDDQAWRGATWLGHPVCRLPTDLHSYQELLVQVRPSWVVLVGDDPGLGGRALFAASIVEQLGQGRVVAVGTSDPAERPSHPRLTHVHGAGHDPAVAAEVRRRVGTEDALVLIGLGSVQQVVAAFDAYEPLVPVAGYVVVENTVLNGRPVAPGFGPGPHEAVTQILRTHADFVPDVSLERHSVTFNRNGYLHRTAAP